MENCNIAFIEGENMILCEADNSTPTEFSMQNEETMMEKTSQTMDIEEEDVNDNDVLVPLRTLMDIDTVGPNHTLSTETASPISLGHPRSVRRSKGDPPILHPPILLSGGFRPDPP
jgi:hypothetical protein